MTIPSSESRIDDASFEGPRRRGRRRRGRSRFESRWGLFAALALASCTSHEPPPFAPAQGAIVSLAGSSFEIDDDANLVVDGTTDAGLGGMDWMSVTEARQTDFPTGQTDDSFGQGTKEDTPVPSVVAGSIPPNKSDLLDFGVYLERNASGRFLHLFWHRVQDPTGTTNMDFEFNQSTTTSANGETPVRTSGDLLVQYDLAQGGTHPQLFLSRWIDGTEGATAANCEASPKLPCWRTRVDLTSAGVATGSINTTAIPVALSDGLAVDIDGNGTIDPVSPRTFGEATVDFSAIVGSGTCTSFGSAYLKSRSSDSFTAALKDFIRPVPTNISNCGGVTIHKTDDAGAPLAGATFVLYSDAAPIGGARGAEDAATSYTCTTPASGSCTIQSVIAGPYWVVETVVPAGHDGVADVHVDVTADSTVSVGPLVDPRHRGAIRIVKTRKHAADGAGDHPHAGVTFTVTSSSGAVVGSGQTNASGVLCLDGLLLGTYTVTETVPTGYQAVGTGSATVLVDNKATCADNPYVGEGATFENMPLSSITVSFASLVQGGTAATIACTGLTAAPTDATPNAFDDTSETITGLVPGTYNCQVVIDP